MKQIKILILVLLLPVLMSSCSLLFAPMHPRDNPLDTQGVLTGPKQLIVTTTSNQSTRIKMELANSDENSSPDGIRIVRNSVSPPANYDDGEKIRDIPLSALLWLGGSWYSYIDDDSGADAPDTGELIDSNRYFYAVWTYDKNKTVYMGPEFDYTDIQAHTALSYSDIVVAEDGFVTEDNNTDATGVLSVLSTSSPQARSLIKFNVDLVTADYTASGKDFYIKNAVLMVYTTSVTTLGNVLVSPILRTWDFGQITGGSPPWEFIGSQDFIDYTNTFSTYVTIGSTFYNWDVTEMVRDWYELEDDRAVDPAGFVLWSEEAVEIDFDAVESGLNTPRLTIEYFFDAPE